MSRAQLASTESPARIELDIVSYEFPTKEPDRSLGFDFDANWLIVAGSATTSNDRRWNFRDACLVTAEAAELADWLDRVGKGRSFGRKGPPQQLEFTEPCLAFRVSALEDDTATIDCVLADACAPPWSEDREQAVSLVVPNDQIRSSANRIRAQLAAFPVR